MDYYDEQKKKTIKLYRPRDDGAIGLKELHPNQFSSEDDLNSALDFFYSEGFVDTYTEAKEIAEKRQKTTPKI